MTFKLKVTSTVRAFVATLSSEERGDFFRCLDLIAADPHIDGHYKTSLPRPPVVYTVYYDGAFSIVFHLHSAELICVTAACRGPYLPPPSEFERRRRNGSI